ncbi:hypothetical protein HELRODRAFT_83227 [Helobdella robusta]|uniref:DNA topoisomerase (ATP-hydrolyzing) n=1 Tax=Helobdella robusta TaxID=6412 RepID=T1G524_HELRO|nr:hypothetical protein HELRODRAFT_83227 [Helobdella robusta]ESO00224.1 hypothetical protein HELRODRAFT_83227 [Helobdella robusta]
MTLNELNKIFIQGRIFKVLSTIYANITTNSHSTKRDLYYQDPKVFDYRQSILNSILENVVLLLKVPRCVLNVYACSKGLMAGNLKLTESNGFTIDCQSFEMGISIPSRVESCSKLETEAQFLLIVEKDASFQRIVEDKFHEKHGPCIIITGKGFPDVNTRLLVKMIWDKFKLPIYCLVDADPHGIEILSTYKYGSKSLCRENHKLAVPNIKWLGILPSDIEKLHIPKEALMPLTKLDVKKANRMLKNHIADNILWKMELKVLLKLNMKAEIQCLDNISRTFLVNIYLPKKLRHEAFI